MFMASNQPGLIRNLPKETFHSYIPPETPTLQFPDTVICLKTHCSEAMNSKRIHQNIQEFEYVLTLDIIHKLLLIQDIPVAMKP